MSGESESLIGVVERLTYHSAESGYRVARLKSSGHRDLVTIVGSFPNIQAGQTLKLAGIWREHPKFGQQFQVSQYQESKPATITGIEKYLGSGLIKGVGPVTAKRIVAHFGLDTLDIIEYSIERLHEVPGIAKKRVKMIAFCLGQAEGDQGSDGVLTRAWCIHNLRTKNLQALCRHPFRKGSQYVALTPQSAEDERITTNSHTAMDVFAQLKGLRPRCNRPLPWQNRSTELSPGRVAQAIGGVLTVIGTPAQQPKPRGKSPGWIAGQPRLSKTRYPVVKKSASRSKRSLPKPA